MEEPIKPTRITAMARCDTKPPNEAARFASMPNAAPNTLPPCFSR